MKPTISSNLVFDSIDYAAFGGSSSRGSSGGGGGGGGGRSSSSRSRGASVRARQERERKEREAAAAAAAKKAHEEAQRKAEQQAAQRRAEEKRRKEREMQAAIAAAEKAEKERQEREAAAAKKETKSAEQRAASAAQSASENNASNHNHSTINTDAAKNHVYTANQIQAERDRITKIAIENNPDNPRAQVSIAAPGIHNTGRFNNMATDAHSVFLLDSVKAAMKQARIDTNIGPVHEEGGWVYTDGTVDRWPKDPSSSYSIPMTVPDPNKELAGSFHTHPQGSHNHPSLMIDEAGVVSGDLINQSNNRVYGAGLPGVILAKDGVNYYY